MYFDDLPVGARFETGTHTMTRAEIIEFAKEWDAQPFHVDDAAAKESPYGQIIASGFHTVLVAFNLTLKASDWSGSSMGSPGMDSIRWIKPVFPGDVLQVHATVESAKASRSKPDRGFVEIAYEILNQQGDMVASYKATHMLRKRAVQT